jgi:hypothetical protein
MSPTLARIDGLLATLNSTDVGTLESISERILQVRDELEGMDQPVRAAKAGDAAACLARGELAEFRRLRAFLQSKIGHLRR